MEKRNVNTNLVAALLVVIALLGYGLIGKAGSLNPSASPEPTMKTLDEVEARIPVQSLSGSGTALYTISQSGSYYLTGNISGVIDKHGIEITASDVTIDLNGYSLIGPGNTTGTVGDGICASVSYRRVTVSNRSISYWRNSGIASGPENQIKGVKATYNGGDGISVGYNSTVIECVTVGNTSKGMKADDYSVVNKCAANENGHIGIYSGMSCVISFSTAYQNGNDGIDADDYSLITSCAANQNGYEGIDAGYACTVSNCTANENSSDGIEADNSLVTGNTCIGNDDYNINNSGTNTNNNAP